MTTDQTAAGLRREMHYDGRSMLCYADRPPDLGAMFDGLVRRFADRPAIVEGDTLSYRELDRRVETIGANLAALGVAKGDRVALYLGNGWEFLAVLFACVRIGAIVVPLGVRQRHAELEFTLNNSGAKVLILEPELSEFLPAVELLPDLAHRFSIRGVAVGARAFEHLLAPASTPCPRPKLAEEDIAIILYTSGTTGQPKGAQLTHLGLIHSALAFSRLYELTEKDRALVAVPLSHVTGIVGVALAAIIAGGCVVLMREAFKAPTFLALAAREKITYSILVPTIYTLCAMQPDLQTYDLSAWRIGCFGGAPMPVATIEALAAKLPNLQLLNAYGATETTSPTTAMRLTEWRDHIDSIGRSVPCAKVRIVDDNGVDVPPGTPGEIWVSGPMVTPGYWKRPDANASEFVDGFWRSGDLGSMDEQGFLRIFDRKKDMINRGGFKIFSAEVENIIAGVEGVIECAILGRPDPVLGERVHAIVVVADGATTTPETVRAWCAERLSNYKVPETVLIRSEPLPRNANGKLMKPQLRAALGKQDVKD